MSDTRRERLAWLDRHVDRFEKRIQRLDARSRRFSRFRGAYAVIGFTGVFLLYRNYGAEVGWGLFLGLGILFLGITRLHKQVEERLRSARARRDEKREQIARATLDWDQIPVSPLDPSHPNHPFRDDLNLTGPHSLHDLLDTAASTQGSQRLAEWLSNTEPDREEVFERQRLVRELIPLSIFRDGLKVRGTLSGERPGTSWNGATLLNWVGKPSEASVLGKLLGLLSVLALLNIGLIAAGSFGVLSGWWRFSLPIYAGVYLFNYRRVKHLFDEADHVERALSGFGIIAHFLERRTWRTGSTLRSLCAPFGDPRKRPSTHIRRIRNIAASASSQKSEILVLVVNAIGPWDVLHAWRLDRARMLLEDDLREWLDIWYDLEAHSSLATFAALNPGTVFPELVPDGSEDSVFSARDLGHPLVPFESRIVNDLDLGQAGNHILLTGSNMSGKSTFLRTVGVTICLAWAGAPVVASSCRMPMLRLFTCIQVADSLEDGFSFFYAEVSRLKALLDELERDHSRPLVFLIDEIFRGTNNRERLTGSRSFLRSVFGKNGVGIIATHDLELADLAEASDHLENRHFRDDIRDGRMVFDYKLHDGPCPTTNALRIMKAAGLPVDPDAG